jgi:hypothetical protein
VPVRQSSATRSLGPEPRDVRACPGLVPFLCAEYHESRFAESVRVSLGVQGVLTLNLRAVQFFSRPISSDDHVVPKATLTTKEGRQLQGYLKIQVGSPMLVGAAPNTKVRPNYAHLWETQEGPSVGAVQWVDPYAEVRWPAYGLASFSADVNPPTLETAAKCDILQRMRTLVSFDVFDFPELKGLTDQLLAHEGYRYGYWTPDLDFVRNPRPAPGKYHNADPGEPLGPGHASLSAFGFADDSQLERHELALVWSQAFSFRNRTNAHADDAAIRKRAQEIKRHYNSKDELTRAEDDLRQHDVKGCVRSAAAAVDAALRYYCSEWCVKFPTASIPFDQKIERILQQAARPTYQLVDPIGLRDLLYLYRARNAIHEGDCYYKDDQLGKDVYCEVSHARRFFAAAQAFAYWIDSQA